jgi:hypothetical protein
MAPLESSKSSSTEKCVLAQGLPVPVAAFRSASRPETESMRRAPHFARETRPAHDPVVHQSQATAGDDLLSQGGGSSRCGVLHDGGPFEIYFTAGKSIAVSLIRLNTFVNTVTVIARLISTS